MPYFIYFPFYLLNMLFEMDWDSLFIPACFQTHNDPPVSVFQVWNYSQLPSYPAHYIFFLKSIPSKLKLFLFCSFSSIHPNWVWGGASFTIVCSEVIWRAVKQGWRGARKNVRTRRSKNCKMQSPGQTLQKSCYPRSFGCMQWVCKHELAHRHSGVTGGGAQETLPLIADLLAADRLTEQGSHCLQLGTL